MIPYSLKKDNECYYTLPILKKFCKAHGLSTNDTRDELMRSVINFAKANDKNEIVVREWSDDVLREGIKHIYFRKAYFESPNIEILRNEKLLKSIINSAFEDCPMAYLTDCESNSELKLQSHVYQTEGDKVVQISFFFSIILLEKNLVDIGDRIIYPVFVDIDLENGYIIGRAKSKASLYYYSEDNMIVESHRTNAEKVIFKAMEYICKKLSIKTEAKDRSTSEFRKAFYKLLLDFTFTPDIIKNQIEEYDEKLESFMIEMFNKFELSYSSNAEKAKSDLRIFLEKYLSINHSDQHIFTEERDAYPIKLIATDSEYTKVETTTINKEPLQCKAIFFDNKKSLEYEKTCDGLILCYNRISTKYFGSEPYLVKIHVNKGYGIIKFESYVEEEDIQNVLSRIINNREL